MLPQPSRTWWTIAAMALGPMLLGHTLLNYALRYLPAHVVNLKKTDGTSVTLSIGADNNGESQVQVSGKPGIFTVRDICFRR